jgi:hypothetical protein
MVSGNSFFGSSVAREQNLITILKFHYIWCI